MYVRVCVLKNFSLPFKLTSRSKLIFTTREVLKNQHFEFFYLYICVVYITVYITFLLLYCVLDINNPFLFAINFFHSLLGKCSPYLVM